MAPNGPAKRAGLMHRAAKVLRDRVGELAF